ncbi:MAG: site-specific integrase [Saprospiraceae bacterium]|nr:site-specific integrase [Saprospiraceae bacterium]MCF8252589.1 site-specific integrase [Saprospiraceae bacterium]MCF8282646.1 site-specific integrase [Bacteroidales bacterium]MCF8314064.1 site-specific integrase [Saprospiraceae bacterium]MCF8442952.1 site-specific integrase [Saprospiraceae bacterium]
MLTEKKILPVFNVFISEDLTKEAFIHWTDLDGKRRRIKGGLNRFRTLEERRAAAAILVAKLQAEYVPPSSVADKMLGWVELNKGTWRIKSYRSIRSIISVFLEWLKGREPTPTLMRDYFAEFANTHHAKSHNEHLHIIKRVFKYLEMPELMQGLETRKAISTPAKYFQTYQIARIKKHLLEVDPTLWMTCQFIYYCFIRPGELRLVKVGDIHFDEWKICVRANISKNKKEQYVTIPIAFRPSLESLKFRSPREFIFFTDDCTKPVAINHFLRKFRRALTTLGFGNEYQLYSWKHTGAVSAVRAGASLKELQIQLRHHSLEEVDKYIRQLGVNDLQDLEGRFPGI